MSRAFHFGGPLALLALLTFLGASEGAAEPIVVSATPAQLDREDPSVTRLGPLRYVGGFALNARDRRFGGLSGLVVEADRLTAVTDRGFWYRARLVVNNDGRFTGIDGSELAPILSSKGEPLKIERGEHDAEAITKWNGTYAVAFERFHRIGLYDPAARDLGRPDYIRDIPGLAKSPANGGIEALAGLDDGRLLALTEDYAPSGDLVGWLIDQDQRDPVAYPKTNWKPTDAAYHPTIGLLVLERRFSALIGFTARVRLIEKSAIVPGRSIGGDIIARFAGSTISDNFEGIAVSERPDGRLFVWLISDDNFNFLQQTLLLGFVWDPV